MAESAATLRRRIWRLLDENARLEREKAALERRVRELESHPNTEARHQSSVRRWLRRVTRR